jgi:serine/threonine protein phosphatase PrpC
MEIEDFIETLMAATETVKAKMTGELADPGEGEYLTEFGCKNFAEYLTYLGQVFGELNSEQTGKLRSKLYPLKGMYTEEVLKEIVTRRQKECAVLQEKIKELPADLPREDQKFFHHFLLEFNRNKAARSAELRLVGEAKLNEDLKRMTSKLMDSAGEEESSFAVSEQLSVRDLVIFCSDSVGKRPVQEDTYAVGIDKHKGALDAKKIPSFLKKAFKSLGEEISADLVAKEKLTVGSTSVLCHYGTDQKLTIANVGDSRAVLFLKKPDGKIICKRLTNDHAPEDAFEKARTELGGRYVESGRIKTGSKRKAGLAMSRAFGDNGYEVISSPDITQFDVAAITREDGAESCFLLTSCDGLYEKGITEQHYAKALELWFATPELREDADENVAEFIRNCASAFDSEDNITVVFADITKPPATDLIISVSDGHGGNAVSTTLVCEIVERFLDKDKEMLVTHPWSNENENMSILQGSLMVEGRQLKAEIDDSGNLHLQPVTKRSWPEVRLPPSAAPEVAGVSAAKRARLDPSTAH